jgi:hypothetical protein
MKNGNGEYDFDSIIKLLRRQNARLEVLLRHLAHAEAILFALTVKALPDEKLRVAKKMKDYLQSEIYSDMIDEVEEKCADS